MSTKFYNKLIRDKIPKIIEATGKSPIVEKVSDYVYVTLLNQKLTEELQEYLDSNDAEELADLVEVIYAILDNRNISIKDFEIIRLNKVLMRGAFKEQLLLKEVVDD